MKRDLPATPPPMLATAEQVEHLQRELARMDAECARLRAEADASRAASLRRGTRCRRRESAQGAVPEESVTDWRPFEPSREAVKAAEDARYARDPRPVAEQRCPRGFFCLHEPQCPGAANPEQP